jgi:hypothetical protein
VKYFAEANKIQKGAIMKRIIYGKYAGFKKDGVTPIPTHNRDTHLTRASWLTAMVESGGKFGCVINYDGTGMTAGLHQAIAVYPAQLMKQDDNLANDQGPLWKLLNLVMPETIDASLWDAFDAVRWLLARDNTVRHERNGELVSGLKIRDELTGSPTGVAPESGPKREQAERWVRLFHEVFADPATYITQEEYGMQHFAKLASRARFRFATKSKWQKLTMDDVLYKDTAIDVATFDDNPELDLALCMYWSHSVNAPGIALKKISKTLEVLLGDGGSQKNFARAIIKNLGTANYGRWSDDIKGGRYQRTRTFAMNSGFWPSELFNGSGAIMPRDL